MDFIGLFGIAVGLSMDAFAVAVCKGLGMKRVDVRQAVVIALFFGAFQGLMPLVGWALGTQFERFITPVDHWIAFALLAFIGAKMLWDGLHGEGCEECGRDAAQASPKLDLRELVMVSVATSIDALPWASRSAFFARGHRAFGRSHRHDHVLAVVHGRGGGQPLRRALRAPGHVRRRRRAHPHRHQDPAGTPRRDSVLTPQDAAAGRRISRGRHLANAFNEDLPIDQAFIEETSPFESAGKSGRRGFPTRKGMRARSMKP